MKTAQFFELQDDQSLQCTLCPQFCTIADGEYGFCSVRLNRNGKLYSMNYNALSAINLDPIEKKPLYHFHPGSLILSLGSYGCNLHCQFCQNWQISRNTATYISENPTIDISTIIQKAKKYNDNIGLAFTYNEPVVWFEYMKDMAIECKKNDLKTVMVTNGFINKKPLSELTTLIDAFSIDLKAFENSFYQQFTGSKLHPVLNTIKYLSQQDKFIEITNLVIENTNDSPDKFSEMVRWIEGECGDRTILHISRYFPHYRFTEKATSTETMLRFLEIAKDKLPYVYLGNMNNGQGQHTHCPECGGLLIKRSGYRIQVIGLSPEGECMHCHQDLSNDFQL